MEITELRKMSLAELKERLLELRKAQFKLRMQKASGQLKQTHLIRQNKLAIAQLKTVMQAL